jgi:hypothetical protein
MLPDHVIQLLTGFVDGELSKSEHMAVQRLLEKSSEARGLLIQLQENAHKIKQLPSRKVEPSLVDEILAAIVAQQSQPRPAASYRGVRRRWLPYLAASLAASLLVCAFGILYWKVVQNQDGQSKDTPIVKNDPEKKVEPAPQPNPQPPSPPTPRKGNPLIDLIAKGTVHEFMKPVPIDLPFSATFAELKSGSKSSQLAREINNEKAIEFDIRVKNNAEAMNRLKDVLRDYKINLVADDSAAKPVNDKKVQYLVFADNLKPDELTKLMGDLSQDYVKSMGMNQVNVSSPYKNVTVTPITKEDDQKLTKLLGEPTNTKSDPKGERKAVVLPVNPAASPSAAVVQFAKQRPVPQAGTVQILIRIHQD